jgi:hypothetical protein
MIECSGGPRFQVESAQAIAVEGKGRRQNLDRHFPPDARVARPVDLPHPARPDGRDDLVRPQARAGTHCHEWG